jgi:hypothetical protein
MAFFRHLGKKELLLAFAVAVCSTTATQALVGMTHHILQSDIELARKLLAANRPEAEIVAALTRRGVEPAKATRLVEDLQCGRAVAPEIAVMPRRGPEVASKGAGAVPNETGGQIPPPESSALADMSTSAAGRPTSSARRWTLAVLLVVLAAGAGLAVLYPAGTMAVWVRLTGTRPASSGDSTGTTPLSGRQVKATPVSLEWELGQDGLRLAGNLVTSENVLKELARRIGYATRTNQIEPPGKVIYAYDGQGLLVYSQPGAGEGSIVLDFEALGGTYGTALPFAGELKVEGTVIRSDTDAQTLEEIKSLGLTHAGPEGSIFKGRYQRVGLCFAYRPGLQRLRSIEIDLK